jgi:hypothetical protein
MGGKELREKMPDALMTSSDREEALSRAYVGAVAAAAGYVTAVMDFDRDGVDVQIRAAGHMRPTLDIQLKATINLGEPTDGEFRFPLKRRNYDLLREQTMIPRILVVLGLPRNHEDWLTITTGELIMRRCAYWSSLIELPETENKESVTIRLQGKNQFDVAALRALMDRARTGGLA